MNVVSIFEISLISIFLCLIVTIIAFFKYLNYLERKTKEEHGSRIQEAKNLLAKSGLKACKYNFPIHHYVDDELENALNTLLENGYIILEDKYDEVLGFFYEEQNISHFEAIRRRKLFRVVSK